MDEEGENEKNMGRVSLVIWGDWGIRARSVYPPHPIKRVEFERI